MSAPTLWLSFLEEAIGGAVPRLRTGEGPEAPLIELTDRARWVLAAIALPRELAPEAASDDVQRIRLGSRLWSSGEIIARIPYQHRSTIRHALTDLRARLGERGLDLEDYLLIDTGRGRYGVRADRVTVDLIDLHALLNDPDALDRRLDAALGDRSRARLAPACAHLLADSVSRRLDIAITASAARAAVAAASATADSPSPASGGPADDAPAPENVPGNDARAGRAGFTLPFKRRSVVARGLLALVIVAAATALIPRLAGGHRPPRIVADGPPRIEVSGGPAHTWSNPITAGGRQGPEIFAGERVMIACRTYGFVVQDGNRWWYLIDSKPWSRHYFVTADTFYNNGRTKGSLHGSAFVDRKVAGCGPLPSSFR